MGVFGGARGVIVPHNFVKAIGDIFIVNKTSLPDKGGGEMAMNSPSDLVDVSGMD